VLSQNFSATNAVHAASEDAAVWTYRAHNKRKHHSLFLTPLKHFVYTVCEIVLCFNMICHWFPLDLLFPLRFGMKTKMVVTKSRKHRFGIHAGFSPTCLRHSGFMDLLRARVDVPLEGRRRVSYPPVPIRT